MSDGNTGKNNVSFWRVLKVKYALLYLVIILSYVTRYFLLLSYAVVAMSALILDIFNVLGLLCSLILVAVMMMMAIMILKTQKLWLNMVPFVCLMQEMSFFLAGNFTSWNK